MLSMRLLSMPLPPHNIYCLLVYLIFPTICLKASSLLRRCSPHTDRPKLSRPSHHQSNRGRACQGEGRLRRSPSLTLFWASNLTDNSTPAPLVAVLRAFRCGGERRCGGESTLGHERGGGGCCSNPTVGGRLWK